MAAEAGGDDGPTTHRTARGFAGRAPPVDGWCGGRGSGDGHLRDLRLAICPWALREGVILERLDLPASELTRHERPARFHPTALWDVAHRLRDWRREHRQRRQPEGPGCAVQRRCTRVHAAAFEMASRLGYDGVEVMVMNDTVSQDPERCDGCPTIIRRRFWPSRTLFADHPGSGAPTRGPNSCGRARPPRRWAPARWSCPALPLAARLRPGFHPRTASHAGRDRHPLRRGEHVPVARRWPGTGRLLTWLGYPGRGLSAHHLDLSHTAVSGSTCSAYGQDLGDSLTHPPRRRRWQQS